MEVKNLLKFLNLSIKEFEVYRFLISDVPKSIFEISSGVNIPRTTLYTYIDNLISKGLVRQVKVSNKHKYLSNDPSHLKNLVAIEKAKIDVQNARLNEASSALDSLLLKIKSTEKSYFESALKVLTGNNSIAKLYDEIMEAKEVRSFLNSEDLIDIFPENAEKFSKATSEGLLSLAILTNNLKARKLIKKHSNEKNYLYKFFPKDFAYTPMDCLIFSEKVVILERTIDPVAYIVDNVLMYDISKAMFDLIWSLLPEEKL